MSRRNGESVEPPCKRPKMEASTPSQQRWRFISILDPRWTKVELRKVAYWAATVKEKKDFGRLIWELPPIPAEHSFLKRIAETSILLRMVEAEDEDDEGETLKNELDVESVRKVDVVAEVPLTRKQADWARKFWPVAFHHNAEREQLVNAAEETSDFATSRPFLVEQIERVGRDDGPDCVVLAPEGDRVLVEGNADAHLFGHSVIRALQTLGEWNRQRPADDGVDAYLGTGCLLVVRKEPCAMCAMAALHFRIAQLFYLEEDAEKGVFNRWPLHLEPSLNHHYKVFRVDRIASQGPPRSTCDDDGDADDD